MVHSLVSETMAEGELPIEQTNYEYAPVEEVLAMARAGQLHGLPLPIGFRSDGCYTTQPRKLTDGTFAVYLMFRWHNFFTDKGLAYPLGRLI